GARHRVRGLYVEIELLDPIRRECAHELAHEVGRNAAAAGARVHVEVGQRRESLGAALAEDEPDRRPGLVLGEERDAGGEDVGDLAALLLRIEDLVRTGWPPIDAAAPDRTD